MISNCGADERGRLRGGKAGDQTGREWNIIPWYNRPWTCVLRHPNKQVREKIAELAEKSANNNKIGYDQHERYTFWKELQAMGYEPDKITVACETDCSAGVAAIVKATGFLLDIEALKKVPFDMYTGNERAVLKGAGFSVLTDKKYLTSDKYLYRGDILLYDNHHTATNLTDGAEIAKEPQALTAKMATHKDKALAGRWRVTAKALNMRTGAGTDNSIITVIPQNALVRCYGYYSMSGGQKWLYVVYRGYKGYCSMAYLKL